LVFLDESGVNTNLTRLYGRAPSSQRAVDHAPLNTPQTTTVLSSIRLDGEKAFTTYQGGTTGERFVQYLKETLLPTLRQGDIVVMDNMRSHHVKAVREILEAKGMKVLYLPPYSPDLNPIEKMWSKMKAILRSWKIRSLDLLPDAILKALSCVSPLDCSHWFAHGLANSQNFLRKSKTWRKSPNKGSFFCFSRLFCFSRHFPFFRPNNHI